MGSSPRNTYKNLYQHLQKEFRSGVISLPDDREILVQLIYSALLENRPAAVALEAFETIENSFIDWNELRVSTAGELCDLVPALSNARNSCERLRQTLQVIFQATYKFDLEEWREKGEEAFRDYLGTIPYVTPFMKNYTVAAVFRRSAVPLDEGALRVLRLLDLVDVNADNQEVPIGLERVFSKSDTLVFAKMLHELGAMLMDETQSARAMRILRAVDPESAQRTFIPLVDVDDFDPFRITRELANQRRNSPMKMNFDADMDDVEEEDISTDDSLEEEIPLENAEEWKHYDKNGVKGLRETSTMPGSAGSSWYYMRYIDPHNDKEFADYKLLEHWLPVDLYIGGPEHAVGHLMYSRIWNRYLYDKGLSPVKEPFKKLVHQGMILGENGIKMGKRFPKYVVNPSDIVEKYGADTLRLYEMFMGPLEVSKPWSPQSVEGARKFLNRVWTFFMNEENITAENDGALDRVFHQTVKKVSGDFESLGFNTAISQMMIFVNACYKNGTCPKAYAESFVKMLSCICPHIGEEMWNLLGHEDTIAYEPWPVWDEEKIKEDTIQIPVQVNGKVRATVEIGVNEEQDSVLEKAHAMKNVQSFIDGKTIVKEIYVKGRIVNIVVK